VSRARHCGDSKTEPKEDLVTDKDLSQQGTENSLKGTGNDLKGKLKDAAGGLTGDSSLQAEGKWDQLKGKVQDTIGKGQRELDRKTDDTP
jgi:uncharacterized protein YjbJ (UPF0337 family)